MSEELKPCPKCHCHPSHLRCYDGDDATEARISCGICHIEMRAATLFGAFTLWNIRPALTDAQASRGEVERALMDAADFLDGYAGGHYMAKSCAAALRERAALSPAAPIAENGVHWGAANPQDSGGYDDKI